MNVSPENVEAWPQALLDAADYLEEHDWLQNQSKRMIDGAVCIVGAIATVCVYSEPFVRALSELKRTLGGEPLEWNDHPGRTKDEVISALLRTAKP